MPNVPFAVTDGSLTFLGKRAMMRKRQKEAEKKPTQKADRAMSRALKEAVKYRKGNVRQIRKQNLTSLNELCVVSVIWFISDCVVYHITVSVLANIGIAHVLYMSLPPLPSLASAGPTPLWSLVLLKVSSCKKTVFPTTFASYGSGSWFLQRLSQSLL